MKYYNPVVSGYFPDPSVTSDGEKYYLVNSTFQYFPGVALHESEDLVHWKQIGNVLTRPSQLPLTNAAASGGIYAPTIRYNKKNGRFYMITTNISGGGNFIVYTDDIHGEWSEPVWVHQQGIDPSLCFEDDTCYFCGNGHDENGKPAVFLNEIVPETGEQITKPVPVWYGCGGRFLEGPHLYKIGKWYYLMAAEGGTEYGHMEVYARSTSPYGPYESYAKNPFLTNRNMGGYPVQGVGHADLIQNNKTGSWHLIHLAYRQLGLYLTFHTIGRETYLVPVTFDEDGWFSAGAHMEGREEGITRLEMEDENLIVTQQDIEFHYTFDNTAYGIEWQTLRLPIQSLPGFEEATDNVNGNLYNSGCKDGFWSKDYLTTGEKKGVVLTGTADSIFGELGTPAFVAIRQREMKGETKVTLTNVKGEAGIAIYMDEHNHYDLLLRKQGEKTVAVERLCLGDIHHDQAVCELEGDTAVLKIGMEKLSYSFTIQEGNREVNLGSAQARYLSTEACGGFVGNVIALFAEPDSQGIFTDFAEDAYRDEDQV